MRDGRAPGSRSLNLGVSFAMGRGGFSGGAARLIVHARRRRVFDLVPGETLGNRREKKRSGKSTTALRDPRSRQAHRGGPRGRAEHAVRMGSRTPTPRSTPRPDGPDAAVGACHRGGAARGRAAEARIGMPACQGGPAADVPSAPTRNGSRWPEASAICSPALLVPDPKL